MNYFKTIAKYTTICVLVYAGLVALQRLADVEVWAIACLAGASILPNMAAMCLEIAHEAEVRRKSKE